jgi:long-chain acyl-CoA synthetase
VKLLDFSSWALGNIAIITESGEEISYGSLKKQSFLVRKMFKSKRIVFCVFNNDLDSIILYISLLSNDNVIFFINNNIDGKALNDLISVYSPTYVVIKGNEITLSYKYSKENNLGTYLIYKLGKEFEDGFMANKDLAVLIGTSGSTGSPKFVRISMENLQTNALSIIESLKIDHYSKTLTNLPLNYSYGLSVINTFLTAGGTLIINSSSITSKDFWHIVNLYKPNVFNGVPYHYEVISKFDDVGFSQLPFDTFTQAGGKIKEKTLERITSLCQKYSKKLFVMYGQTEATARISILPSEYMGIKSKSVGQSVPGGRIEIRSLNGEKITSPHTQGEIIYFGKNVSLGYCQNKSDLARGNDNNFELKTGDIGYLDTDNFFIYNWEECKIYLIHGK